VASPVVCGAQKVCVCYRLSESNDLSACTSPSLSAAFFLLVLVMMML
jgi:hypothetical protein